MLVPFERPCLIPAEVRRRAVSRADSLRREQFQEVAPQNANKRGNARRRVRARMEQEVTCWQEAGPLTPRNQVHRTREDLRTTSSTRSEHDQRAGLPSPFCFPSFFDQRLLVVSPFLILLKSSSSLSGGAATSARAVELGPVWATKRLLG